MTAIALESASEIIWLPEPITKEDILTSARIFRDKNLPHFCPKAARATFGDDAIDIVAPGALVLGLVGGMFSEEFGMGTMAEEINKMKLRRCFCPNDYVGARLEKIREKARSAKRFVDLRVALYRNRGGKVEEACRKPIEISVNCPL